MMELLEMWIDQSDYMFIDSDGNRYKPDSYKLAEEFLNYLFEENFHKWVREYIEVVEE